MHCAQGQPRRDQRRLLLRLRRQFRPTVWPVLLENPPVGSEKMSVPLLGLRRALPRQPIHWNRSSPPFPITSRRRHRMVIPARPLRRPVRPTRPTRRSTTSSIQTSGARWMLTASPFKEELALTSWNNAHP